MQVFGALMNGELNKAGLAEISLQSAFHAGWPNTIAMNTGIAAALTRYSAQAK